MFTYIIIILINTSLLMRYIYIYIYIYIFIYLHIFTYIYMFTYIIIIYSALKKEKQLTMKLKEMIQNERLTYKEISEKEKFAINDLEVYDFLFNFTIVLYKIM